MTKEMMSGSICLKLWVIQWALYKWTDHHRVQTLASLEKIYPCDPTLPSSMQDLREKG